VIHINLIKKLRVNKEMTQKELAEACGVSQGTVAQWEAGICFPKTG
jgi:transcriptional regulator with XRE-family HTH domain